MKDLVLARNVLGAFLLFEERVLLWVPSTLKTLILHVLFEITPVDQSGMYTIAWAPVCYPYSFHYSYLRDHR